MNLEDTMIGEISQSGKGKSVWFHLHEVIIVIKLIEMESRIVAARDWREGEKGGIYI